MLGKTKKIILMVIGIIIGLTTIEAYLRYFTYKEINKTWNCYQSDIKMYMVYKPDSSCPNRRYGEYDTIPRINNVGLRSDTNTTFNKPNGVKRILILGDSLVAAHEVEDKETFAKRLENKFKEAGQYVEVLNGGIRGYSPLLSRFYLKYHGLRFDPDIVVLLVNTADVANDRQYLKYVRVDDNESEFVSVYPNWGFYFSAVRQTTPITKPKKINLAINLKIVKIIKLNLWAIYKRWLKFPFLAEDFVDGDWRTDTLAIEKDYIYPDSYEKLINLTKDHIEAINNLANKQGAKFYLVLTPMGHEVSKTEWDLGRVGWGAKRGEIHSTKALNDLDNWAKQQNIKTINLKPYLSDGGGPYFFKKDGHFTVKGHENVAQRLWENLKERID